MILRGNLHLVAPQLHTIGINTAGGIFKIEANTWIDEAAKAEYNYKFKFTEIEIAKKFGIKSQLGNFLNRLQDTKKGIEADSPEGAINAGFAGYGAYLTAIQMMSQTGGLGQVGSWASVSFHQTTVNSNVVRVVPSIFNFSELDINAREITLIASQINAYNAYIEAEKLNIFSGIETSNSNQKNIYADIDIPLSMSGTPSANLGFSDSKQTSEQHLHCILNVSNTLRLHISGKATIKGASISARNLDASFGELVLESVKDILKTTGKSFGIGLSSDQESRIKSISGSHSKGLREIVNEITAIIGTENIKIVIAKSLDLNGALIANAERNKDGTYTDLGNLQLTVAQLFVRHIHQLDEGYTFGASVEFARDSQNNQNNGYRTNFGIRQGSGDVLATLGKGNVTIEETHGAKLNRNVGVAISKIEYDINIDEIKVFYQKRDLAAENKVKERLNNEGFSGIILNEINYLGEQLYQKGSDELKAWKEAVFDKEELFLDKRPIYLQTTNEEEKNSSEEYDEDEEEKNLDKTKKDTKRIDDENENKNNLGNEQSKNADDDYARDALEVVQSIVQVKQKINQIADIKTEDKISANQELDQMKVSIQRSPHDKTILKSVAGKLDYFITEYPWAGHAITALSIVIKSVNVAGFVAAVANEVKNRFVGELSAPALSVIIAESAQGIQEFDTSLTERDAVVIAGSALATLGLVADAKSIIKGMKNILNKLDSGGGFAYAGADGGKFKLDDFNPNKMVDEGSSTLYRDRTDLLDTVKKVGDRYPINADKAGKTYHVDDLPDNIKVKYADFDAKYPDGIRFNEQGFPDFTPYTKATVKINGLIGDTSKDFKEATKAAGFSSIPKGYTWHHVEDGITMQLVPQDIHDAFKHTGGAATIKHGGNKQ